MNELGEFSIPSVLPIKPFRTIYKSNQDLKGNNHRFLINDPRSDGGSGSGVGVGVFFCVCVWGWGGGVEEKTKNTAKAQIKQLNHIRKCVRKKKKTLTNNTTLI